MDTRHPLDRSGLFSDPDDIWYLVDYEPIVPQEEENPSLNPNQMKTKSCLFNQ